MKIYITGSRLETYISCPFKYYLANVRKLQKPFGKPSPLLSFDQALHKTLSSFYRFHNHNEPFDFAKLLKCLDYNWRHSDFETAEESAEYKAAATNSLKEYFEKYCYSEDRHIDTDNFFKTEIEGIEYGGKIDRIDKNDDGTLEIIDYKTGKMPSNGVSELEDSLVVQMLFCACDSMYPGQVKRLTYIYLKDNQALYVERNNDKIQEAREKFKNIAESISAGKFDPKNSNMCGWCDFKDNCPEGQKTSITMAKLKSFLECPKKYAFKYLEKQPVTDNSPKAPLLFYSYINSMLTNLYKGKKLYSTDKLMAHAQKALANHSELDSETCQSLLNDCHIAFEYINDQLYKNGFPESKSLKTEIRATVESAVLSASIDRLDILPNGKLQPVVYKTGKQCPDIKTLQNEVSSALYWYITNHLYENEVDSISFVYLLCCKTINFVPSDIALSRLEDSIALFIKEKAFDSNQSALCSWCDYYGPCPAWKTKPHERVNESIEQFRQRIRLSYSKMSLYLNCPFSYKRLYIDKILTKPQPFFDFGTAIHETFENIYAPSDEIIKKPSLKDIIAVYDKVRLKYRDGFANEQIEEEYHQDGIRQLTLYYNHFIKDQEFKTAAAVEKYFEIPCGKYAVMTGSIDRIDALPDGTYEILDYKTEPTLRPQQEVDNDKQLSIYYWAAKETCGYDISKLSLLMLDHDKKIETTRKESDISHVLESIDKTAYEMLHETNFLPKKNKYCKSCDHLSICPLREEILKDDSLTSMQKFSDETPDLDV